jgi:hypothetical protein
MTDKLSRRDVLQRSAAAMGALAALGAAACGKNKVALVCTDTTGLAPTDAQIRTTLAYQDISTEPGKTCTKCQQFVEAPAAGSCGSCKVLKGPINPNGYCKSFAAKST